MGAINEVVAHALPVLDVIYEDRNLVMQALEQDARELWPLVAVAVNRNGYFGWPTPGREEVAAELDGLPNRAARWLRVARAVGPREWMKGAVVHWVRRAEIVPVGSDYTDYFGGRGLTSTTWELRGDGFVARLETGRDCPPAFPRHGGPRPSKNDFVFDRYATWRFE